MIIVDYLTVQTFLIIVNKLKKKEISNLKEIIILDYFKPNLKNKLFKFLFKIFKIKIKEKKFTTGNFYTKEKENIFIKSREIMDKISIKMSHEALNKNKWLKEMNDYFKNNTLLLFLSKFFYEKVEFEEHLISKMFICKAIKEKYNFENIHIIINKPDYFDEKYLPAELKVNKINWYKKKIKNLKEYKIFILLYFFYSVIDALCRDIINFFNKKKKEYKATILLVKEDVISIDRSLRTQPHWLFNGKNLKKLDIIILSDEKFNQEQIRIFNLNNIYIVNLKKIKSLKIVSNEQKISLAFFKSLLKNKNNSFNFVLSKLLIDLFFYTNFCKKNNVKAFMTSENYLPISTIMNMLSSKNLLKSFSFQYSNMGRVSPIMQTTSNVMFTFSEMYQERWSKHNIKPKKFKNVGYIYSSSFPLIKSKTEYYKNKFKKKNEFYITIFDENFQSNEDKYGFFTQNDFCNEIEKLVEYTLKNPNTTIITKSQFSKNSASKCCYNKKLEKLIKNKKWLEISVGLSRNIIFPSEATILSDMVIGHAVGGTSSLEAALFGKKSILINPYNLIDSNTSLYNKCNILFENLDEALKAINEYRNGNPDYANLGNWENILYNFDTFMDNDSANRIYSSIIEEIKNI